MTLPQDVQSLRLGTWNRRRSDAWTDQVFRLRVISFMDSFVEIHSWAGSWDVTERFSDTTHDALGGMISNINVRVPRGPTGEPNEIDFKQRPGVRLLLLGVTRRKDPSRFEVALPFPSGSFTSGVAVDRLLDKARLSLEAEHARA